MSNEKILSSDPLDLLFDNRNKMYGAYILRKFYPNRIKTSLLMMLGLSVVFSAFTFLPETEKIVQDDLATVITSLREVAPKEAEKPKPKEAPAKSSYTQKKFVAAYTIVPETDSSDTMQEVDDAVIGSVNFSAPKGGEGPFPGEGPGEEPVPAVIPEPAVDVNVPSDNPDIQASFPGGEKELVRFLQNNLRLPGDLEEDESVVVRVRFVVGFDGELKGFNVVKDGGEMFNREVIRVLNKMPRWIPGKKGGQNIPVYYTIPVKFTAAE